jgi:hypothetical protein
MACSNLSVQCCVTLVLTTNLIAQSSTIKQVSSISNMFDFFLVSPPKNMLNVPLFCLSSIGINDVYVPPCNMISLCIPFQQEQLLALLVV